MNVLVAITSALSRLITWGAVTYLSIIEAHRAVNMRAVKVDGPKNAIQSATQALHRKKESASMISGRDSSLQFN